MLFWVLRKMPVQLVYALLRSVTIRYFKDPQVSVMLNVMFAHVVITDCRKLRVKCMTVREVASVA
jgi:hypothetical protein